MIGACYLGHQQLRLIGDFMRYSFPKKNRDFISWKCRSYEQGQTYKIHTACMSCVLNNTHYTLYESPNN